MRWVTMIIYEIVSSSISDRLAWRPIQGSRSISSRLRSGNGVKIRSDPSVCEHVMGFLYQPTIYFLMVNVFALLSSV
jgi:hypothetical protein